MKNNIVEGAILNPSIASQKLFIEKINNSVKIMQKDTEDSLNAIFKL